jgi:molybdate transport system ATP-binding protein
MSKPPHLDIRVTVPLAQFPLAVDLTTEQRITGIFGPSGSGKTSLLHCIAGLKRKARGRIAVDGEVWLDTEQGIYLPPERRAVGYVPQDGLLFPHRNVRGNLLAGAARARQNGWNVDETLETVCSLLEIGHLLDREVATLSGGEHQRVALGRAICSGPRLLLLDEPLASLDRPLRQRVLPFLKRVRDELALPMLLVTHDIAEVQALCDEVVFLRDGVLVAHGAVEEVLSGVYGAEQAADRPREAAQWQERSGAR